MVLVFLWFDNNEMDKIVVDFKFNESNSVILLPRSLRNLQDVDVNINKTVQRITFGSADWLRDFLLKLKRNFKSMVTFLNLIHAVGIPILLGH